MEDAGPTAEEDIQEKSNLSETLEILKSGTVSTLVLQDVGYGLDTHQLS